ncbi:sigma-54-dependent Fis family transcriptional regulator [Herbaspirillum sp. HC18]|nr:sigma-54-dependent Fis family transcriptional regulator [Herbaspirillum sp. HC18]
MSHCNSLTISGKSGSTTENPPIIFPVFCQIEKIAPQSIDILIEAEPGTGKDTLARHIHELSGRTGAFVTFDCAGALTSSMEMELFGFEAGVDIGCMQSATGKIQEADGGTLYLDEIAGMSLPLQASLMRILEDRHCTLWAANFRVIASTTVPLGILVDQGQFHKNLYQQLTRATVKIPPLRDQRERIPELFRLFVARFAFDQQRSPPEVTTALEMTLISHSWPGNVRELAAAARRHVSGHPPLSNDTFTPIDSLPDDSVAA